MGLRPVADWMGHALCAQIDLELWFPPKSGSSQPAKRICNGFRGRPPCPVRDECLAYALRHNEQHGVWGGMSERERNRIRRRSRSV